MSDFTGKVAIVTGGSSGIGAAVAREIAARGARVGVVASSDAGKSEIVASDIRAKGGAAAAYAADVRNPEVACDLVRAIAKKFDGVDILINAAGVFLPSPPGATTLAVSDSMIDTNIKGTWNCIQAVVEKFKEGGGGKILNFASVAGVTAVKGFALYCASKAAIVMMTRTLAAELAPFNINVNAIAPGNTETPMNEALRTDPVFSAALENLKRMTPSGVTFSKPEEIVEAALFLVSAAARPIHGATLVVDEGVSAAIG